MILFLYFGFAFIFSIVLFSIHFFNLLPLRFSPFLFLWSFFYFLHFTVYRYPYRHHVISLVYCIYFLKYLFNYSPFFYVKNGWFFLLLLCVFDCFKILNNVMFFLVFFKDFSVMTYTHFDMPFFHNLRFRFLSSIFV